MPSDSTTLRAAVSRTYRRILPWAVALAVATCSDDQSGPSRGGIGYFAFKPVYGISNSLSQFGVVADSVHVRLTRPVDQVVLDTTVFFSPDSATLHLALPILLQSSPESLSAVIEIKAGPTLLFVDSLDVEVVDGPPSAAAIPTVILNYVGPGTNVAAITLIPGDTTIFLRDTLFFTATAIDSSDAPVASFYTAWKTSDSTVARINAQGRLIAPNLRGSVRVIGFTPTGIADTTLVTFAPVPVVITADSGGAQSGLPGDSLAALFVARVKGADSLGISGVAVRFAAVTAGGAVRDTFTLVTDVNGRVRTRGVLGTTAGTYNYTATVVGTAISRTFSATANAGPAAAIAIQAGNLQSDSAGRTLATPFTVRVADAFNNPVSGAKVYWLRTVGTGTLALDSSLTNVSGLAASGYTLGTVGIDSVTATLAGTSAFVTFQATAINGAPATVAKFFGDAQTDTVGRLLTDSLIVIVRSATTQPVVGASVSWTVVRGGTTSSATTFTDAAGRTAVAYTLGTLSGTDSVRAQAGGASATFTATALNGVATTLAISSGDGQTDTAGTALPLPFVVLATDAFGNSVAGTGILFQRIAGTGTLAGDTVLTNGAGLASIGYTLGSAGTDSITATLLCACSTVTFTATAISAAPASIVTVQGDSQTVTVNTTADTFAVLVRDGTNNPVVGAKVDWAFIPAVGSFALILPAGIQSTFTDSLGVARGIYTAGTSAGTVRVEAQIGSLIDSIFVLAVAAAPSAIAIFSGSGQSDTVGNAIPLPFVARVTDAFGNPVAGAIVLFTRIAGSGTLVADSVATNASGDAAVGYLFGLIPGVDTIRATLSGTAASVDFEATALAAVPASITAISGEGQTAAVTAAFTDSLVVEVLDGGGTPIVGHAVVWTVLSGGFGLSADTTFTDILGRAFVHVTAGTLAGGHTVEAEAVGLGTPTNFGLIVVAGAPTTLALVSGDGQVDTVGATLPAPFTTLATDAFGNPVVNAAVLWARTAGTGTVVPDTSFSDASGLTSASYTLGALAGTDTVIATLDGTASTVTFTATGVLPVVASLFDFAGDGSTDTVGQLLFTPLTVEVRDGGAQPIAGTAVVWTVLSGGGTVGPDTAQTDGSGHASTSYTLGTGAGSATIEARSVSTGIADTFTVVQVADSASVIAIVSGNGQTDTTGVTLPLPFVAGVTDGYGNPVFGAAVLFQVTAGNGNASDDTVFTDVAGQAQVNFTLGITPAADTIRATLVGTSAFVDFTANGISGAPAFFNKLLGDAQTDTVLATLADSLVVELRDAVNTLVPNTWIYWVAGGATLSADSTLTDINGRAAVQATFMSVAVPVSVIVFNADTTVATGFTLTATAGTPTQITAVAGLGQTGPVSAPLPIDLGALVQDAYGNPAPGAAVTWTNLAGFAAAGLPDTTLADSTGLAYLTAPMLGPIAGEDSLEAQILGQAATALFTATATAGAPSALVYVSGTGQSDTVGQNLTAPFVVQARDAGTNPVAGVWVQWIILSGGGTLSVDSAQTDGTGAAAATLTLGTSVGLDSVIATIAGSTDTVAFYAVATADAPAALVKVSGDSQSATVSTNLPAPMVVRVTDQYGNPIAGVTVDFGVVSGPGLGFVTPSPVTDAAGDASTGTVNLAAGAGTTIVDASTAAIPADTVFFTTITLPIGTSAVWTGAVSSNYGVAGNWSPAAVPSSASNIYIAAAAATQPSLVGPVTVGGVELESGATLTLGAQTMTVLGNAKLLGAVSRTTGAIAMNSSTGTVEGTVPYLVITATAGTIDLAGTTTVADSVRQLGGTFRMNGQTLTIGGALSVVGGAFEMLNTADSVDIGGGALFNGVTTAGHLTSGTLVVRGGLAASLSSGSFMATGTHRTIFAGVAPQGISFPNTSGAASNRFNDVVFANPAGVTFSNNAYVSGTADVQAGTVTGVGRTITIAGELLDPISVAWTPTTTIFTGTPVSLPDSFVTNVQFNGGNIVLAKDLVFNGTAILTGAGSTRLNGFNLRADSTLSIVSSHQLIMQNPADTLEGMQSVSWNGSTTTFLVTDGVLLLHGNFDASLSSGSYLPTGTHRTRFIGTTAQTVSFPNTSGAASNRFNDVEFANSAGVILANNTYISDTADIQAGTVTAPGRTVTLAGTLLDPTNVDWLPTNTVYTGSPASLPDSFTTNVTFNGTNITMVKDLVFNGTATLAGAGITVLNGFNLRADSSFVISGSHMFLMQTPGDTVEGMQSVSWNGSTTAGLITEGVLLLHGNFTAGLSSGSYLPTGTHRTRFIGTAAQTVSFPNTSGAASNRFNDVEFANPAGIVLANNTFFTDTVDIQAGTVTAPGRTITLGGTLLDPTNLAWLPTNTIYLGAPTSLPDSFSTNVTFNGTTITLAKDLVFNGTATLGGAGVTTLNGFNLRADSQLVINGSHQLVMQNAADTLEGMQALFWDGSTTAGLLTDGVLLLHGNFTAGLSSGTYLPTGTHRTRFVGTAAQTISFPNTSGAASNRFNDVVFANAAGITLANNTFFTDTVDIQAGTVSAPGRTVTLAGTLLDPTSAGWLPTNTIYTAIPASLPDTLVGNVTFNGSITLAKSLVVKGTFTTGGPGAFALNGWSLRADSTFTIGGTNQFLMQNSADSLDVKGAIFWNGSTAAGMLTAGVVVARGNFTAGLSSGSYLPSGTHRTVFAGGAPQTISFPNTSSFVSNRFQDLELAPGRVISSAQDLFVAGTLIKPAGATATVAGTTMRHLQVRGLAADNITFDSVRISYSGPAAFQLDNANFVRQDPALTQLAVRTAGGALVNLLAANFGTTPTTGRYISAADTLANGSPVLIGMANSTPLDGTPFELEVAGNDGATIAWSSLVFADQPLDVLAGGTLAPVRVALLNPAGDTATFFTGSVTLAIGTNPAGGTLSGTTTVAAVGGIASFSDLSIDNPGIGYTLDASAGSFTLPSAPFNITLPLAPGFDVQWLGGTSNDWNDPANWSTAAVPDSTTNVHLTALTANDPAVLAGSVFVKRLRLDPGATLDIASGATLVADSSIEAGTTITGAGLLVLRGTGDLTGTVTAPIRLDGTYSVAGTASIQYLDIYGDLYLAADTLTVSGAIGTYGGTGRIHSTSPDALIDDAGPAWFQGGSTTGTLTAGTFRVGGALVSAPGGAADAFAPSAGHTTVLNGSGVQTVNFTTPDSVTGSHFGRLQVSTAGTAFMLGRYDALGDLLITSGATLADSLVVGFEAHGFTTVDVGGTLDVNNFRTRGAIGVAVGATYSVATTTYYEGTAFPINPAPYDTLVLQMDGQAAGDFAISGDLRITGIGSGFDLNGRTVSVGGNVDINSGGNLTMQNAADVLNVTGSFFTNGDSTKGLLTNGLLQIGGNFRQAADGSGESFRASGSHTTRFTGGLGMREIKFDSPSTSPTDLGGSHFGILDLVDGIDSLGGRVPASVSLSIGGSVTYDTNFAGYALASYGPTSILASSDSLSAQTFESWGDLTRAGSGLYDVELTRLMGGSGGTLPALPYQSLLIANTSYFLGSDLTLSGSLNVGIYCSEVCFSSPGELTVGGNTLTIGGSMGIMGLGLLNMAAGDSVDVGGMTTFRGAPSAGHLTGGTLVLRGTIEYQGPGAFQPAAAHRTVMAASGPATPVLYPSSNDSWFGKLVVLDALPRRVGGGFDIEVLDSLILGSSTSGLNDTLGFGSGSLTLRGPVVTVVGSSILMDGSVRFDHSDIFVNGGYSAATTILGGAGQTIPAIPFQNVSVVGTVQLAGGLDIGTFDLTVDGSAGTADLDLNGQTLQVGDFTTGASGTLTSTTAGSALLVRGNATFDGGDETGRLTTGRLTLMGDFISGTVTPGVFEATGSHVTVFNGGGTQSILFGAGVPRGAFNDVVAYNDLTLPNGAILHGTFRDSVPIGTLTLSGSNNPLWAWRVEMTGAQLTDLPLEMSEGSQLDTVNFTFADPSLVSQLVVRGAGQAAPTDLHAITFDSWVGAPQLVRTADTTSNGQGVQVRMFGSTPFDGSSKTFIFDLADPGLSAVAWSQLALNGPLPATLDSAVPFNITLVVKEPDGTNRADVIGIPAISLAANPAGATLSVGSIAAFDGQSANITGLSLDKPGAGVSFRIEMQGRPIDGFTTPTLDVINPAPAGAVVFDGSTSTDWSDASNWSTNSVPLPAEDVFIPGGTSVIIPTANTYIVNTLVLGSGAALDIGFGSTLTVNGNAYAGQTITGPGTLLIAGGASQISGTFPSMTVTGSATVVGRTTIVGDLIIDGATAEFNVGGQFVDVSNTLFTQNGGLLTMDGLADTLYVASTSFAGGDETGRLIDGVLLIQGSNFDQGFGDPNSFHASGNHTTIFGNGGSATAVNISAPGSSQFANVKVQNLSGVAFNESGLGFVRVAGNLALSASGVVTGDTIKVDGVYSSDASTSITLNTLILSSAPVLAGSYNVFTTWYFGSSVVIPAAPSLYERLYVDNTASLGADVTARTLLITGSGQLDVAGYDLLADSLYTTASGILVMDAAEDTVVVADSAAFLGGNETGLFTDGALRLGGGFFSTGGQFNAYGNHITEFFSPIPKTITISPTASCDGPCPPPVQFGLLKIDGTTVSIEDPQGTGFSAGELFVTGSTVAAPSVALQSGGNIHADALSALTFQTISLPGALDVQVLDGSFSVGTTVFQGSGQLVPDLNYQQIIVVGPGVQLADTIDATGVTVGGVGVLDMNGWPMTVSGTFVTSGASHLLMQDPADTLVVTGTAVFSGDSTFGDFTAGAIRAFTFWQQTGTTGRGFQETGSHRVIPVAAGTIRLDNAGSITSYLKTIDFSPAGDNVTVQGLWVTDTLILNESGTAIQVVAGTQFAVMGALVFDAGQINADRMALGGTLAYSAGTYNVDTTVFAGGGQIIPVNVPYKDIEVQYAAALEGDLSLPDRHFTVLNSGILDLNGFNLTMGGTGGARFETQGFGVLVMDDPADTLSVNNARFGGGDQTGLLTAGVLQVGNFQQVNSGSTINTFVASGTHLTEFINIGFVPEGRYGLQMGPDAADTASHFNAVSFLGTAGVNMLASVYAADAVFINNTLSGPGRTLTGAGPITIGTAAAVTLDTLRVLGTLTVDPSATYTVANTVYGPAAAPMPAISSYQDVYIEGAQTLTAPFSIGGSLTVRGGGVLTPNGNTVTAPNSFSVLDNAHLVMTNPADVVDASAAYFDGAASTTDLAAGTLRLRSGLTSGSSTNSQTFVPTGMVTEFYGGGTANVAFTSAPQSYINDLQVIGGTTLAPTTYFLVMGPAVFKEGSTFSGNSLLSGSLDFRGKVSVLDASIVTSGNVIFFSDSLTMATPANYSVAQTNFYGTDGIPDLPYQTMVMDSVQMTLTHPLTVAGQLIITGSVQGQQDLVLNGHTVTAGDLSVGGYGRFTMDSALDTLIVNNNALFGGDDMSGRLTAGVLRIGGNFTQNGFSSSLSFAATGTQTEFVGTGTHGVTFNNPSASLSRFNALSVLDGGTLQPTTSLVATGTTTIDTSSTFDGQLMGPSDAAQFTGKVRVLELGQMSNPGFGSFDFRDSLITAATAGYSVLNTIFQGTDGIPDLFYTHLYLRQGVHLTLTHRLAMSGGLNIQNPGNAADTIRIRLNGNKVSANGMYIDGYARVTMDNAADTLEIFSNATFRGVDQDTALTAGVIRIGGYLQQMGAYSTRSFAPAGTLTEFYGSGTHNAVFANPASGQSRFGPLAVVNNGTLQPTTSFMVIGPTTVGASAHFDGQSMPNGNVADFMGPVSVLSGGDFHSGASLAYFNFYGAGALTVANGATTPYSVINTGFSNSGNSLPDLPYQNLYLTDGVHDTLTFAPTIAGLLSLSAVNPGAQDFVLNGQTLTVNSLITQGEGRLTMANAADHLTVTGNATFDGGSTTGRLTNGLLEIHGNFTQAATSSPSSFDPGPDNTTFLTHFTGGTGYTATFATPDSSRFGMLQLDSDTLQLNSDAVAGYFQGNGGVIASSDLQLKITADMAVDAVTFNGTRVLFDGTSTGFQYFDNATFVNMNPVLPQLKLNYDGSGSNSLLNNDFDDAGALFVEATSVFLNPFSLSFNGPDVLLGPARTSTPDGQVTVTWP